MNETQLIAAAREQEYAGAGVGKTCNACHLKKLACPPNVRQHRWQHVCPPHRPTCVDFATCPTKYKKGM